MTAEGPTGRWGDYGGRYTAEALWETLETLARSFEEARRDAEFTARLDDWLDHRLGRPTPLARLEHLSREGASLWVKREDLIQGGSFCTSLAIFYAFLGERMGCEQLIGETASGDFGAALGAAGAALGMRVRVFMGREDIAHEPLRVAQMRELGVQLEPVDASARGRRAAGAEAVRSWLGEPHRALYCTSMLTSPDPYPRMIAYALGLIGAEARVQARRVGAQMDFVVAPMGTGGFAAGLFGAFLQDPDCQLIGVQAGGEPSAHRHASSLINGEVGIFQGTRSRVLQDAHGQLLAPYSIAGGLCAAGVGPQHAWWADRGAAIYLGINDAEAREAQRVLAEQEGLSVSLEAAHAFSYAMRLAPERASHEHVLVGVSGDGRRDLLRPRTSAQER